MGHKVWSVDTAYLIMRAESRVHAAHARCSWIFLQVVATLRVRASTKVLAVKLRGLYGSRRGLMAIGRSNISCPGFLTSVMLRRARVCVLASQGT